MHTHQKLWSVNDGITIIIFVHIKCSACHLLLVSLFVHPSFDPALALKIVNTFNAGTNNGTNELILFYESMPNGRMIKAKHIRIYWMKSFVATTIQNSLFIAIEIAEWSFLVGTITIFGWFCSLNAERERASVIDGLGNQLCWVQCAVKYMQCVQAIFQP